MSSNNVCLIGDDKEMVRKDLENMLGYSRFRQSTSSHQETEINPTSNQESMSADIKDQQKTHGLLWTWIAHLILAAIFNEKYCLAKGCIGLIDQVKSSFQLLLVP